LFLKTYYIIKVPSF